MPDHPDHSTFEDATPTDTVLELEAARVTFAATRVRALAKIELSLLEKAVRAPDDDSASQLELQADTVWRDALAISAEHNPNLTFWLEKDSF